jgi:hypothetical protein
MKNLLVLIGVLLLSSCVDTIPVLNKNEYKITDTTDISQNSFNMILGYEVIIEIDSSFYSGRLNSNGDLVEVNPRKLKLK